MGLGGLLTVLGGAGAGGFKAMGENIDERAEVAKEAAKQAALEKRETNLARLQHGFRKEELGMGFEATAAEAEKGRTATSVENIRKQYAEEEKQKKEQGFKAGESALERDAENKRNAANNAVEIAKAKMGADKVGTTQGKLDLIDALVNKHNIALEDAVGAVIGGVERGKKEGKTSPRVITPQSAEDQARKEANEKAGWLSTDTSDFGPGGKESWIKKRSQEILNQGGIKKNPVQGQTTQTNPKPPPVPGAKLAADGKWYVPNPKRPGKYLRVD